MRRNATTSLEAFYSTPARKWEQEQRRLIAQRSPEQIARMEAAIGKAVGEA